MSQALALVFLSLSLDLSLSLELSLSRFDLASILLNLLLQGFSDLSLSFYLLLGRFGSAPLYVHPALNLLKPLLQGFLDLSLREAIGTFSRHAQVSWNWGLQSFRRALMRNFFFLLTLARGRMKIVLVFALA